MFDDLLEANRRYQAGFEDSGARGIAKRGLAVVTCIDSRIDPLGILGLNPGDAKILRNAGARITDDAIRSLILATNLLGVDRICIVHHTDCAVIGSTDEELRQRVASRRSVEDITYEFLASPDPEDVLRDDVEKLRAHPLIPDDVAIGTFVYDVRTGYLKPTGDTADETSTEA